MKRLKSKNHLLIAAMLLSLLLSGCSGSEQPGVVYKKSAKSDTVRQESVQPESGPKVSAQSESVSKTSAESGTVPKESVQAETVPKESAEGGSVHNEPPQALTGKADAVGKKAGTDTEADTAVDVPQEAGTGQAAAQDSGQGDSGQAAARDSGGGDSARAECLSTLSHDGYTLEQVVVLSRHNIRSPFSSKGALLERITPYEWVSWSSNPSELSLRGGALETMMGQYFRKWMEEDGLFPENYQPEDGAVRIYANAKQRTIATAQFFSSGLLPTAGPQVETHVDYDDMDPAFKPQLTFVNDAYIRDIEAQVMELHEKDLADLEDNYRLLEDILDIEDSPAWQNGEVEAFRTDDTELILNLNAEPNLSGSLKMAGRISDALVLQYYEEPDQKKAAFGHELTQEQWRMVGEVKDTYQEILFALPLIAPNVAHPLLMVINDELADRNRKFTFLCGHDSNLQSVLGALGAEDYILPYSIENEIPIGSKLVFSRWTDADSGKWISLDLVYQTADQLRGLTLLDMDTPPAIVPVTLKHMERNEDGLYAEEAVMSRIEQAIAEYDQIKARYE